MFGNNMSKNDEKMILSNGLKSITYLHEAFATGDLESAKLEIQEINYVIDLMEQIQVKKERKELLEELILSMKLKGIDIKKSIVS